MTVRVVLVEDHALFRAGVRAELADPTFVDGGTPRVEIVGEAASVEDGVAVIRTTVPDVVLLDVHLPGGGGHAVISALRDDDLATRFLALSVSDAAEDVIAVVRAGAGGYVTKTISAAELVDAIARVADGDAVFSPRLAGFVLDAFSGDLPAPADPELDQLTGREQEAEHIRPLAGELGFELLRRHAFGGLAAVTRESLRHSGRMHAFADDPVDGKNDGLGRAGGREQIVAVDDLEARKSRLFDRRQVWIGGDALQSHRGERAHFAGFHGGGRGN